MNKNIGKVIALALTISAFSGVVPATLPISIGAEKAYASSDNEGIKDIKSNKGKMYKKSSYSSSTSYKDSIDKYYIKLSDSTSKFKLTATEESGYKVKILDKDDDDVNGDEVSIKKGKTLSFKVVAEKDGKQVSTVTVKVKRVDDEDEDKDEDEDEDWDDIYLDELSLVDSNKKDIDIKFKETKSTYDINVKKDISYVKITAEPEDDEYSVRIDGETVEEDDDWEKKVTLKEGKNEIVVRVKNGSDKREYKLNITRETSSSSNNGSNSNNNSNNNTTTPAVKTGWIQNAGAWYYNDANGNPLKNTWFYDRGYGKTYYLDSYGKMATGWLMNNSKWYYLGTNGAKTTGWQIVGGTWYYLDSTGAMQTGWFKDTNGKFYYLNASGAMLSNTTVGGYKLGKDGAWTGK